MRSTGVALGRGEGRKLCRCLLNIFLQPDRHEILSLGGSIPSDGPRTPAPSLGGVRVPYTQGLFSLKSGCLELGGFQTPLKQRRYTLATKWNYGISKSTQQGKGGGGGGDWGAGWRARLSATRSRESSRTCFCVAWDFSRDKYVYHVCTDDCKAENQAAAAAAKRHTAAKMRSAEDAAAGLAVDCCYGAGCRDIECDQLHPQSIYERYKRNGRILEHLGVAWDGSRSRYHIRGGDRANSELLLISRLGFDTAWLRGVHARERGSGGRPDEGHAVAEGAAYRLGVTALERYNVSTAIDQVTVELQAERSKGTRGFYATLQWSCVEHSRNQPAGKPVISSFSPSLQDRELLWVEDVMLGMNKQNGEGFFWDLWSMDSSKSHMEWGMSLMDKAEELDDYYGEDSFAESVQSMYDDQVERRQLRREKSYP